MNIGELRKAINKLSRDFDDTEIVLRIDLKEKEKPKKNCVMDLLAFVWITPDYKYFVLGSHQAALTVINEGKVKYHDGTTPKIGDNTLSDDPPKE